VLEGGIAPQATVMSAGAVITGKAAGLTVMVLITGVIVLPYRSVADHDSVTFPPQAFGMALKVEVAEPLIRHSPVSPLL
jgi:hypothetical protein